MPHQSLKLIPGVDQNKTLALNETAYSDTQLIRFVPDRNGLGLAQKYGGWQKFYASSIGSIPRALHAWEDINSNSWLGVGGEAILGVINDSSLNNITPQTTTVSVAVSFSTTGSSDVVTIDATASGLDKYDAIYIRTQVSIGGLVLFGLYNVLPVSANQFQIMATNALGKPAYATSTVAAGGAVPSFDATSGDASISVTLANHGLSVGSTFPILVSTYIAGITLFGNYVVTEVTSANVFTITANATAATFATTATSGTGVTATVLFSTAIVIPVGSTIVVAGVTPAGYNATAVVTASSAGSVSYLNATTGIQTVAGTVFMDIVKENSGSANFIYYNGIGPLSPGSGFGVGGFGTGGFGSGSSASSSTGTPITATDWTLDNWGENLISCPLDGPIFEWSPTSNSPVATIIAEAPQTNQGILVAMPQRQIIAWGSTFNGVQDPMLIRYCDVNDYYVWIAQTGNQAGSFRIPNGSKIVQCVQGPQQTLIWTDIGLWAMQYSGPPYIYQFNELGKGCGLIGRKAACIVNGSAYWMGQSQFFRYSGQGVESMPCPIWDVIFQDLDDDNLDKIRVAPNSRFGEIMWFYPTTDSGENTKYVKVNLLTNPISWDFGTLVRTAWINESVLGPPIGASSDQYIYQHETSTDADGQAMTSYFQTGYAALSEADLMMFIDQVWPDMKWGYYGGAQNATVKLTFYVADYPGDTPRVEGPFSLIEATQFITPRLRGRLVSIKIESSDLGSFWRLGNIRYRIQPDGKF